MKNSYSTAEFILSLPKNQRVTLTRSDIIWLLEKNGHTVTSIAKEIGFSRGQVSTCLNGRQISPKVRQALIPKLQSLWLNTEKSPLPLLLLTKIAS